MKFSVSSIGKTYCIDFKDRDYLVIRDESAIGKSLLFKELERGLHGRCLLIDYHNYERIPDLLSVNYDLILFDNADLYYKDFISILESLQTPNVISIKHTSPIQYRCRKYNSGQIERTEDGGIILLPR